MILPNLQVEGHYEFNQLITNLPWNHQKILFLMISGWLEVSKWFKRFSFSFNYVLVAKICKRFQQNKLFW